MVAIDEFLELTKNAYGGEMIRAVIINLRVKRGDGAENGRTAGGQKHGMVTD